MKSRAGIGMVALVAILGVLVVAGAGYWWWTMPRTVGPGSLPPEQRNPAETVISGEACRAQGGEVVNTLTGTANYQPSEVLGEIREANCPCLCVKRAATDDQSYQGVIAEFLTQWPEIQKTVPFKPVLGGTTWYATAFEFLSPTRFIISFEDGHVAGALVADVVTTPSMNLRSFSVLETVHPNDFPFTVDAWYALLAKYGGSSDMAKTYVTSVVRGTEVITFNGWVEVPENPFVKEVKGIHQSQSEFYGSIGLYSSDFGYQLNYPKNWKVEPFNDAYGDGVLVTWLNGAKDESSSDRITIREIQGAQVIVQDAKFGPTTLFYDAEGKRWMRTSSLNADDSRLTTAPASVAFRTISGLEVYLSTGRWRTYIIPLSSNKFLTLNIGGSGVVAPLDAFVQGVVISESSVPTEAITAAIQRMTQSVLQGQ